MRKKVESRYGMDMRRIIFEDTENLYLVKITEKTMRKFSKLKKKNKRINMIS